MTAPVSSALKESSNEIVYVAEQAGYETQQVLLRLSRLLIEKPAGFVGVDLARTYPPETLLPDRVNRQAELISRVLAGFRDALVFLPVAITWWFLATSFGDPIPADRTFLDIWGKDLAVTAAIVCGAIVVVILVTLGLHAWDDVVERRTSQAALRDRLGRALVAATLALADDAIEIQPVPAADIQRLGYYLSTAISGLEEELRRTGEELKNSLDTGPASRFAQALEGWSAAASNFSAIAPSLMAPAAMLQDFVQIRKDLTEENLRLMNVMRSLVLQVQQATESLSTEAQAHHGVANRVLDLSREVGRTLDSFGEQARSIIEFSDRVYDVLREQAGFSSPQVPPQVPPQRPPGFPSAPGYPPPRSAPPPFPPDQRDPYYDRGQPQQSRPPEPDDEDPFTPDPPWGKP
ncbi:hypothetical protein ACQP2E_20800 [Actinoplanes sp. CA-015351]|uniref:hypothetical protein n=1 Tax=Actinoplanes sp. CA-015351 TaxID=3239897 RepID=UPI003D98CBBF